MRALTVLCALVAAPLFVAAAQNQSTSASDRGKCEVADANRNPTSAADKPNLPATKLGERPGCSPVPPAPAPLPPPPPPPPPPPAGNVTITGKVFNNVTGRPGLAGWLVVVTGTTTASVATDAFGVYTLAGLPAGTYTICEVLQAGWTQTSPTMGTACGAATMGYTFTLAENMGASFVNFGNVVTVQ